jgi:uncharacterized protein (DUF1697 family)
MNTYIALFRGINLLGVNRLPMTELKIILERNGCCDVRTYIQSGNAILKSPIKDRRLLAKQLTAAVLKSHGFQPRVIVLTAGELEKAIAANPFPQGERNPTTLHLFFLDPLPKEPNLKAIEAIKVKTEAFALKGAVFYLYTPDGFGTSKLAKSAERFLGVDATARNWRTVTTLLGMVNAARD